MIVLICSLGVAAQECKYDFMEKDKLSGKVKAGYWYFMGSDRFTIYKIDTLVTIEITGIFDGAMELAVQKGQEGMFRLGNGTMVSFTVRETVDPIVKVNGSNIKSTYIVHYDISTENLLKLTQSPAAAIKAPLGSAHFAKALSIKKAEKLREAIKCIIAYH